MRPFGDKNIMIFYKTNSKNAYTLIEMMIGILLAFIVAEGAVRMLGNIINADEYEKHMVTLHSDSMHISEMLSSDLKKAGLFLNDDTNNQPFDWLRTNDGGVGQDSISIIYQNINDEYNCNSIQQYPNIENDYYVADGDLYCGTKVILENVVLFQVLYGLDFNDDRIVDRYLNANNAEGYSLDVNYKIIDVKFDVIVASEREYTSAYDKVFYVSGLGQVTYTDGRVYRNITRSTVLKNML